MEKGSTIQGCIEKLTYGGDGILRLPDQPVVFVPRSTPGDEVEVIITEAQKRFARGEIKELIKPSPDRTRAFCSHYDTCGGCHLQHLHYSKSLEAKKSHIQDSLNKIGKTAAPIHDFMPAPAIQAYRNRALYRFSSKTGLAFVSRQSKKLFSVKKCPLLTEDIQTMQASIDPLLQSLKNTHLAYVSFRSTQTHDIGIIFSFTEVESKDLSKIQTFFEGQANVSIYYNVIPPKTHSPFSNKPNYLCGKPQITEKVGTISFSLTPHTFFQTNHATAEQLLNYTLEQIKQHSFEHILDVYSGAGFFSLALAAQEIQVVGIENNLDSVMNALQSLGENKLTSYCTFKEGNAEDILPELALSETKFDAALLDPPRKGLSPKTIESLIELNIPNILYVSCNPSTFARDARIFLDQGYTLKWVQPFDMFPQTYHIELLGMFTLN